MADNLLSFARLDLVLDVTMNLQPCGQECLIVSRSVNIGPRHNQQHSGPTGRSGRRLLRQHHLGAGNVNRTFQFREMFDNQAAQAGQ